MTELRIYPAAHGNLESVMSILDERVDWLRKRGSDQWSTHQRWRPEVEDAIVKQRVWILWEDRHRAIGTITMSRDADPDFWTEHERATPALYLAKLATRLSHRGRGFGELMLEQAQHLAYIDGVRELRLDAWKTSAGLHRYYEQRGWTYLRTVHRPGRFSGSLFSQVVEQPPRRHGIPPIPIMSPGPVPPSPIIPELSSGIC